FTYHLPNLLRADALCLSPKDRRVLLRVFLYFLMAPRPPKSTLFPYTTLFRSPQNQILKLQFHYRGSVIKDAGNGVLFVGARESRSEEHTSELQSRFDLVCRLLLEKKKAGRHSAVGECDGVVVQLLRATFLGAA